MKKFIGGRFIPGIQRLESREVPAFLAPIGSPGWGYSPSVADFNHDGRDDLAAITSDRSTVGVSLSNGDGTFRPPIILKGAKGDGLYSARASDVNGDGHADVVAFGAPKNAKYTGNCGDGGTDQCIGVYEGTTYENVWLGNGDGTFRRVATTSHPHSTTSYGWMPPPIVAHSATADFNRDGINDWAEIDSNNGAVNVFLRNSDGTSQPAVIYPAGPSPQWVLAGDFNGDGWTDLVVTDGNTLSALLNDGTW